MTSALFLLRCAELNLLDNMDDLSVGMVNDIFTEKVNDSYEYKEIADQSDFDRF